MASCAVFCCSKACGTGTASAGAEGVQPAGGLRNACERQPAFAMATRIATPPRVALARRMVISCAFSSEGMHFALNSAPFFIGKLKMRDYARCEQRTERLERSGSAIGRFG